MKMVHPFKTNYQAQGHHKSGRIFKHSNVWPLFTYSVAESFSPEP